VSDAAWFPMVRCVSATSDDAFPNFLNHAAEEFECRDSVESFDR
jgi:hypothetical protein